MRTGSLSIPEATCAPIKVQQTQSYWERLRGLLGRSAPLAGTGMLISPCSSVHTFWMGYAIDVVFLGKAWNVLRIVPALAPARAASAKGAAHVLEMAAGQVSQIGLEVGQTLLWSEDTP